MQTYSTSLEILVSVDDHSETSNSSYDGGYGKTNRYQRHLEATPEPTSHEPATNAHSTLSRRPASLRNVQQEALENVRRREAEKRQRKIDDGAGESPAGANAAKRQRASGPPSQAAVPSTSGRGDQARGAPGPAKPKSTNTTQGFADLISALAAEKRSDNKARFSARAAPSARAATGVAEARGAAAGRPAGGPPGVAPRGVAEAAPPRMAPQEATGAVSRGFDRWAASFRDKVRKESVGRRPRPLPTAAPPQPQPQPHLAAAAAAAAPLPLSDPYLTSAPPSDFGRASVSDLRAFLQSAGCSDQALASLTERSELAELSRGALSAFEVRRVNACAERIAQPEARARAILRVGPSAAPKEVRRKFLDLARLVHPDKARPATAAVVAALSLPSGALPVAESRAVDDAFLHAQRAFDLLGGV